MQLRLTSHHSSANSKEHDQRCDLVVGPQREPRRAHIVYDRHAFNGHAQSVAASFAWKTTGRSRMVTGCPAASACAMQVAAWLASTR